MHAHPKPAQATPIMPVRPLLTLYSAPPCPRELIEIEWGEEELGEPLTCHLEVLPADRGAREYSTGVLLEPDTPACATLWAAYFRGADISAVLSGRVVQAIKAAALAGNRDDA